jgi:antitoxin Phd
MNLNSESLISIAEIDKDFSKLAKVVDKTGTAILLDNDIPRYIIIEFPKKQHDSYAIADKEEVFSIAERIINEHRPAFEALSK